MSPLERDLAPGETWVFDEDVAEAFDDMLDRSIPQIDTMRGLVNALGFRFLRPYEVVLDLGCARGGAIELLSRARPQTYFVGYETSEPMLAAACSRFEGRENVRIVSHDLREGLSSSRLGEARIRPVCLVLSILTLQFVPIEYRPKLLGEAKARLRPGGGLILVEKTIGATPVAHEYLSEIYREKKIASGYTTEEVDRKRLALEGALFPVTAKMNEELLLGAGFREVECFWRWANFAGWVAIA